MMTCRSEILKCIHEIKKNTGRTTFTILDILECFRRKRLKYEESTVRTHIVSWMCRNSPTNRGTNKGELERIGYGKYQLAGSRNLAHQPSQPTINTNRPAFVPQQPTQAPTPKVINTQANGRAFLLSFGFKQAGYWYLQDGKLAQYLPDLPAAQHGLYAFVLGSQVLYIGKTSNTLKRRLYAYLRPGPSQRTNIRANAKLTELLKTNHKVDILCWTDPSTSDNNDLFLDKAAGYELSLIRKLLPPWNTMR